MSVCVICAREREARVGLLCLGHFTHLGEVLRAVEEEAVTLDARPSMAVRTGPGGGSLASERAPARLSVLVYLDPRTKRWERDVEPRYTLPAPKSIGPWCLLCEHETCVAWRTGRRRDLHDDEHDAGSEALASVLGELHAWARLVREERALAAPAYVTITGERDLLTRQLDWIAEQPWVDECFADLRKILGQLQAVNHTAPDKPVGRCYLPTDTGVCDGPVWVDDAEGHAQCGRCRQTWDGPQMALLKHEMERQAREDARPKTEDGRRMLTARELVEQGYASTVSNVRVRAHRRRVAAVRGHYDPEWFIDKASA